MPLFVIQGDIATTRAEALVNAANNHLQEGAGVCGAIFAGAGRAAMQEACDAIGHCQTGQAVITPAFDLPAQQVIHTVGPVYVDGTKGEEAQLRAAYQNSLKLAAQHGLHSIAFPLISTGVYGYPRGEALKVATQAILDYLKDQEEEPTVTLVLYDKADLRLDPRLLGRLSHLVTQVDEEQDGTSQYLESSSPHQGILRRLRKTKKATFKEKTQVEDWMDRQLEEESYSIKAHPAYPAPARDQDEPAIHPDFALERSLQAHHEPYPQAAYAPKAKDAPSKQPLPPGSLDQLVGQLDESFSVTLLRLIDKLGKKDPEVYKKANLDRRLFSKIRSNPAYRPGKNTVLALSIALELSLPQTQDLLARAGFALSPAVRMDVIVGFFINQGIFDIYTINEALFYYDQPLLGEVG